MESKSEENRAFQDPDCDEAEETLSLSDLPIYSSSIDTRAAANHRLRHRRHQEDFEFFSEDFTASTRRRPPDSIVFCGKIIYPFQEVVLKQKQEETDDRKSNRSWIFRWKWNSSFAKSKSTGADKSELSVQKVSVRSKSSWWYLFGLGNYMYSPAEMELRDIKMRQRRRRRQVLVAADDRRRRDDKWFWGLY